LYCFGDRKTIENSSAFVNKLSNWGLSFKESSLQAEIFIEAFDHVMLLPGDWHMGMNMLQSIYKLFWTDLLEPFHDLLWWQQISKDIRGCYFQASRLVQYANDVIYSYLICLYILKYYGDYKDMMNTDEPGNVMYQIAVHFEMFLSHAFQSTYEHLKLLVNFLFVSSEFLKFVAAYRAEDSITVRNAYKAFAPIWKILG
jgi:hypothetical protein